MAARRRPSPLSGEWLRLRWSVGEARRAREIAGGSAAACGGGDGRMARVTGGEGRGGYIYRADAGPATFTGPCSGRHRGLACRPKHGTDLVPGRHGHAACRARTCSGRASPCRATGRPAGRPEMDMYSGICRLAQRKLRPRASSPGLRAALAMHLRSAVRSMASCTRRGDDRRLCS